MVPLHLANGALPISDSDSFSPGPTRVWNETKVDSFDIMPDGKRIVAFPSSVQKEPNHAIFLLNYMDDLLRRLPGTNLNIRQSSGFTQTSGIATWRRP